jgi:hypothetical protein
MNIPENIVIKSKPKRTKKPKVVLPIETEENDNDIPYTEEEKNKIWLDFCGGIVVDYPLIDTYRRPTVPENVVVEERKLKPRVIKLDKNVMSEKEQNEYMKKLDIKPYNTENLHLLSI